ncbi:MAG: hypothetical protein BGO82_17745 [Devosia sp. 67-54]|uniref:DUF4282 domain-containing protein n=1 Tax=unclassified Devosia TaxID=196773 RepID=UPI00086A1EB5|nr:MULTISPECIES: DUF4282 domain-containing protein [unclassified Devosia]MBN9304220.1 DUF4282 domain-containing protein [Devosia sp.]ODU62634.1 MAG: hypothetical protein ABT13_00720 [Pelagibacterium sp. SCN 68-10]OJX18038.1 MAG: hypothetical protein BGO82_17745 [Devosia sp. 67-54]
MTSDDLRRIFMGSTLFRLDTVLSPRLIPVLYVTGLATLLMWAVTHLVLAFASSFGDGLWSLLEIVVYGSFGLVMLRTVCEALLVWFKANEAAADSVSRTRISTSLLEDVRDAIHEMADEEDEIVDVDDLITPATDPAPDVEITPPRGPRRTARRTPSPKL